VLASLGRSAVLLHPGSGSRLKDWPADRWARVGDALAERGCAVVVSGGADDLETPARVAAAMQHPPLLLAGKTTLGQLGALAEQCRLVLGTDSGPLHLAAALGAPTLRLYGPSDERIFGPWPAAERQQTRSTVLPCRPCGNLVAAPCGAAHEPPCMLGMVVPDVVAAACELLETAARSSVPA
jgi:ADP-heptose:LPS heptosyltransferase